MKILADGTRIPESAEERRRLEQEMQDVIDEAEADLMSEPNYIPCPPPDPEMMEHLRWLQREQQKLDRSMGIPERWLTGYTAEVVNEGACVVPGCRREARTFCDEHQDSATRPTTP